MTPAAFVMMDALPFTPNGKVDSKKRCLRAFEVYGGGLGCGPVG
jgi:hypothetical protein